MNKHDWVHQPECGTFEYQRTYLDGNCLTCLLIIHVREDERSKYVNPNCVWGEGECIPDCPSCKRLDDLYAERMAGAAEERAERMADAGNGVGHWMHCPNCGFRHEITWAYNCGRADVFGEVREAVADTMTNHTQVTFSQQAKILAAIDKAWKGGTSEAIQPNDQEGNPEATSESG